MSPQRVAHGGWRGVCFGMFNITSPNNMNKIIGASVALMLGLVTVGANAQSVFINEIDYDNVGADNAEWVELAGLAGMVINNTWSIELFNGATGSVSYGVFALSSFTFTNESNGWGFYVLGIGGDFTPSGWTTDEIQNGAPDMIVLRNGSGTIIQSIVYEGTKTNFTAVDAADSNSIAGSIYQSTTNTVGFVGGSSWAFGASTLGALNTGQTFSAVPEPSAYAAVLGVLALAGVATRRRRVQASA